MALPCGQCWVGCAAARQGASPSSDQNPPPATCCAGLGQARGGVGPDPGDVHVARGAQRRSHARCAHTLAPGPHSAQNPAPRACGGALRCAAAVSQSADSRARWRPGPVRAREPRWCFCRRRRRRREPGAGPVTGADTASLARSLSWAGAAGLHTDDNGGNVRYVGLPNQHHQRSQRCPLQPAPGFAAPSV